jgi:hypothetical protein
MSDPDQTRREEIRWSVLEALYRRPNSAFEATQIRTVFLKGRDYSIAEVEAALTFLHDLQYVKFIKDPMGSTKNWQIASQGTLAFENR